MLGRVEKVTNISRSRYEDTQYLRYLAGQRYEEHTDFIHGQNPIACGPRVFTFFVYLSDSPGAGTNFPSVNITVPARRGTAALWQNVRTADYFDAEQRTKHAGLPPSQGDIKYAANVWIHQHDFRRYNNLHCLLAGRELRYYEGKREKIAARNEL